MNDIQKKTYIDKDERGRSVFQGGRGTSSSQGAGPLRSRFTT